MATFLGTESTFAEDLKLLWFDSHLEEGPAHDLVVSTVGSDRMVFGTNFGGWDTPTVVTDFDRDSHRTQFNYCVYHRKRCNQGGVMKPMLIHNARLFCGVDEEVIDDGTVWVTNGFIRYAGPSVDFHHDGTDVEVYDAEGKFVMPGMTESHVHLSYNNAHPQQLNNQPLPLAMLDAVENARVLLGSGFTSAISFGSAQGLDVPLRDAINEGRVCAVPDLQHLTVIWGQLGSNADGTFGGDDSKKIIADGPWAIRKAVRSLAKKRCDIVKIFLDGEALNEYAPPGVLTYSDEEVDAAVSEAHIRGMRAVCHSRSAEAVKQAVRFGVDIIGHANYLDEEAVAMLEAERHRIFVGPGIAWEISLLDKGAQLGLPRDAMEQRGYQREVDETIASVKRLRESNVRVLRRR